MQRRESAASLPAFCMPLISLAMATWAVSAPARELFVSPERGDDAHAGTRAAPLASLAVALAAARETQDEPVTIFLLPGKHYLSEPLVVGPEDSRKPQTPLAFVGLGEAIVSGGAPLQLRWRPYRDGILQADVPSGLRTDQLFIDGVRLHMARYPNYDAAAHPFNGAAADVVSRERVARWQDPAGGFFHAMHRAEWGGMHYRITGKNAEGDVVYEGGWQNNRESEPHAAQRFVENIFEELDAPGEWYLDEENGRLYLYPPEGVDVDAAEIEAVRLESLFELRGDARRPVRNVHLRNLTLLHTTRTFMKTREQLLRSDWTVWRSGALVASGVEDCRFQDLTIREVGGNGVFVDGYARRVEIIGCHITGAGASSVSFVGRPEALRSPLFNYHQTQTLGEMDQQPGPQDESCPASCRVFDCLLTRNGRFEKQTAGVNICMASEIHVSHCSIYDVPRAGVNICDGAFGGHVIEHCDVFDTVQETGDHGSFNSWGRDRFWHADRSITEQWLVARPDMATWDARQPTILRHSRWRCDRGWDIDLDDGSSNYRIYDNLCLSGGIKLREGYHRVVENNVLVNNTFHPHVWYARSDSRFERNIVFAPYAPALMKPENYGPEIDRNFLHVDGRAEAQPAAELTAVSGADAHSLAADARFAAPSIGDYSVQNGSPAVQVGFENFPMTGFGVVSERLRRLARTPILPGSVEELDVANRGWGQTEVRSPHKQSMKTRWHGALLKNMQTEGERSAAGLDSVRGVMVIAVQEGSPAARLGLQPGDVILGSGGPVANVAEFVGRHPEASAEPGAIAIWRNQADAALPASER